MKEKIINILDNRCMGEQCVNCIYQDKTYCSARFTLDKILQQFDIVEKGSQLPKPQQFYIIEDSVTGATHYINKDILEYIRFSDVSCLVVFKNASPLVIKNPKLLTPIL